MMMLKINGSSRKDQEVQQSHAHIGKATTVKALLIGEN